MFQRLRITSILILAVTTLSAPYALGEEPDPQEGSVNPLSAKEELIRDRFNRFEDRIFRLREKLLEIEPGNAGRLGRALERAGELGLSEQLDQLVEFLRDPSTLTEALENQNEWIGKADRLLAILLERESDNPERDRELQRLEQYRKELRRILREQQDLRGLSARLSLARRLHLAIEQALQRLSSLQERQTDLVEENKKKNDPTQDDQLGARQMNLGREAEQLSDDLRRLSDRQPAESADSPVLESSRADVDAASERLSESAKAMREAGEDIRENEADSSRSEQRAAQDALGRARQHLEKAKQNLERELGVRDALRQQRKTAKETDELSQRMQEETKGDPHHQQQGGRSPTPPGQQSLDSAKGAMDGAAEALEQDSPEEAIPKQDRAIEELQQAQRELEKSLDKLRKEQREEVLRDLENRLREMLAGQRSINKDTQEFSELELDEFARAEQLLLADLSTRQSNLSERAATCVHILDEEGTTIVFPRVVGQLAQDMSLSANRLARFRVDLLTLGIQQDILDTLNQLLEAVKRMKQDSEQRASSSSSGDGNPPLLPTSAELKLLRAMQFRVNTRTDTIASINAESPAEDFSDEYKATAERQAECAQIARELRDRKRQP